MGSLLLICCLLGYFFFIHFRLKLAYNLAIPFTTAMITAALFIAALLDTLETTTYAIYSLGTAFFIYSVLSVHSIKLLLPKELLTLSVLIILYYLRVGHAYYMSWDDFSLWAIATKEIHLNNGFLAPGQDTSVLPLFSHYTRIPALFNYFITKAIGYSEGHNLFAGGLLCILFSSALLVSKRIWQSLMLVLGVLAATALYTPALRSLYVDGIIGIIFGALISTYLQEENKLKSLLYIIPILFIMPNVKEVGFWLAYAGLAIIAIHMLWMRYSKHHKMLIPLLLVLTIVPWSSHTLWENYLGDFGITSQKTVMKFESFVDKISPSKQSKHDKAVILEAAKSVGAFARKEGSIVIYVLTFLALYLTTKYNRTYLKNLTAIYCALSALFFTYLCFRLSIYLMYPSYIASYVRYYGTYAIVFAFVAASFIKFALKSMPYEDLKKVRWIEVLLAIIFFTIVAYAVYKRPPLHLNEGRKNLRVVAKELKVLKEYNLKVMIVYYGFDAFNCYQLNYELSPLGKPEDLYNCSNQTSSVWPAKAKLSPDFYKIFKAEKFNDVDKVRDLNKYDILYIPFIDQDVLNKLSEVIEIDINALCYNASSDPHARKKDLAGFDILHTNSNTKNGCKGLYKGLMTKFVKQKGKFIPFE